MLKIKCAFCGKEFYKKESRIKRDESGNIINTCSVSCANRQRYKNPDYKRKMDKILRENNRKIYSDPELRNKTNSHLKTMKRSHKEFCKECNEETTFLNGVGCMKCHNKSNRMRKAASKNMLQIHKDFPEMAKEHGKKYGIENLLLKNKFCKNCNQDTLHRGNVCTECQPEAFGSICPNFIIKNDILYYKEEKWEDYKDKFKLKNVEADFDNEYNGFWQNTYRLEENSIKGQDAMERELIEKNVGWFVYIKFYIDKEENIKPLVVGKTGSKLVNISGTDIKFDLNNIDHSPGRRFIADNNFEWYKDKIYVIPCNSEKEAKMLESKLQNEYYLFGS